MPGILCEHCTATCCTYVALPIETPETCADFDDIRWFLIHEGLSVFVEDGDWYVLFQTPCRHLQPDYRCGIYHSRPRVCRAYSTENCDYHSGDYGWQHHFTTPEHLDAYLRDRKLGRRLSKTHSTRRRPTRRPPTARPLKTPCAPRVQACDRRGVALPVLPVPP